MVEESMPAGGAVLIDLIARIWLLLPISFVFGNFENGWMIIAAGLAVMFVSEFVFQYRQGSMVGLAIVIFGLLSYYLPSTIANIPTTIYSLAQIVSIQLLPLSAFPNLELAATWILWVFIALMFTDADWKNCVMMLAIGGVAMNFIAGIGIFAVADAEVAATYADLTDNTNTKNKTSSGLSNIWLMLTNPRLWYEQEYGYKNETMAQGEQTSPYALEITKAMVLERAAPPGSTVTFDVQVTNKGKRAATLKKIEVAIENENLGVYHRYDKPTADFLNGDSPDILYLYFVTTPTLEAHYKFCDNPYFAGAVGTRVQEGFTKTSAITATRLRFDDSGNFEPAMIDEFFADVTSPECYGTQMLNSTITYGYNVDATYNLELIDPEYYKELAMNRKLTFHTEDSTSSEGPLKLTIRSVPPEQPVRLKEEGTFTVFYSISNIGPGTAVIEDARKIYLEQIDATELRLISGECNFETGSSVLGGKSVHYMNSESTPKFFLESLDTPFNCAFEGGTCIVIPPNDLDKIVILKCDFEYRNPSEIGTTKTMFMKMHVDYSYMTTKKTEYRTIEIPESHTCVTKRALDGFANKTDMDIYLRQVFIEVDPLPAPFSAFGEFGLPAGTEFAPTNFC